MKSVKCVVVGDGLVGKSCLLLTFTTNTFPEEDISAGFDMYCSDITVDSKPFTLNLLDTPDQDFNQLLTKLCSETDVFIICFSIASPVSYENVKCKWYPESMGQVGSEHAWARAGSGWIFWDQSTLHLICFGVWGCMWK
ncbi:rho-related GTP-binding protein RhoG-like [Astyanax mexicanus]|uniref:Rho-related GTP-binding protein RhoG-like n=1 Tax=Astyanax mexicanus TaxID=7994 RepID=A0A8T2L7H0_ASTMX|nr:rho-related GTP-binding protein RhoG-like [Astyanax mexicanus]